MRITFDQSFVQMEVNYYHCEKCGSKIPELNRTIHELRCKPQKTTKVSTNDDSPNVRPQVQFRAPENDVVPSAPVEVVDMIDIQNSNLQSVVENSKVQDQSPNNSHPPNTWTCSRCTFDENSIMNIQCEVCGNLNQSILVDEHDVSLQDTFW